jgi:hypothetical protein
MKFSMNIGSFLAKIIDLLVITLSARGTIIPTDTPSKIVENTVQTKARPSMPKWGFMNFRSLK